MNKPRPLEQSANEDQILDELLGIEKRHLNDAKRHTQEAAIARTLRECLRERFVADLKKGRK